MQPQAHTVSRSNFKHPDMRATHTDPRRSGQSRQNKETSSTSSSYEDNEALSLGASRYYSELFALYTHEDPVDTAPARDLNIAQDNMKTRPVTVFPSVATPSTGRDHADGTQYLSKQKGTAPAKHPAQSFLKKQFKKAKEIYKNGPPGEAEVFWTGVKTYLQNREPKEVLEMVPPKKHYETGKPPTKTNKAPNYKQIHRQDSAVSYGNVSRTSREIPIMLRPADLDKPLPRLPVEVNKPLPRYPPVDSVFGQRPQQGKGNVLNVNKPLPPTPMPCSLSPPKRAKASDLESPIDARWASPSMQTVDGYASPVSLPQRSYQAHLQPEVPLPQTSTQRPQQPSPIYGSQTSAGKFKSSITEKEREKMRAALKATISRPVPIEYPVDMPTAYVLPQYKFEHGKTEERQKAASQPGWLDKFAHPSMPTMPDLPALNKGRKRRDSDASFACQGIVEQGEYEPAPLFTGNHDGMEQRMTGRWI